MSNRPKVSAFYLIKNEEEFGPFSIRSIYNVVDEIVVVDNGSTDRTKEVFAEFDKIKWFESDLDDFAELKNFAISKCTGEWVLRIDGDEVFYSDIEQVMPVLLENNQIDGYTCRFINLMFGFDHMQNIDEHDNRFQRVLLWRNKPEIKFKNKVHPSMLGLGPRIADSGLHYMHYGYAKPMAFTLEKLKQYAKLMGEPYFYEGRTAEHLFAQAERRPIPFAHPQVIADYIQTKGCSGGKLKPPVDLEQLRNHIEQIANSEVQVAAEAEKKRTLEIAPLPDCFTSGMEHLDIRPLPHVDIVADIRNMPIADNTYDVVFVPGYLLEHLPYHDILKSLRECFRIAKEGAYVMFRTYDARQIATAYAKGEISNDSFNKLIFGDNREGWEMHRCMLDNATLQELMKKAGFVNVNLDYYENWMIQIGGTKPHSSVASES